MKKMRNIMTVSIMAAILLMGATFANGGIIVAGQKDDAKTDACKDVSGIIVTDGIIVAGMPSFIGDVINGIIVAGSADKVPCTVDTNGIIVAG